MRIPTEAEFPDDLLIGMALVFPCPRCGHEFTKALSWFKDNDHLVCPGCEHRIVFDTNQFRIALKEFSKALKAFWASVSYEA